MKRILIAWIPAFMATIALVSSCYGTFFCDSIVFHPDPEVYQNDGTTPYPALFFGPWYQRETQLQQVEVGGETQIFVRNVCVKIPSTINIDSKWKTVRAFGILTMIFGCFILLPLYFLPCYGTTNDAWKTLAFMNLFVMTLLQGMTFLWFADGSACDPYTPFFGASTNTDQQNELFQTMYPNSCQKDGGTNASITAIVLYFCTGIAMLYMGTPNPEPTPPPETQEVVYERTLNPDGTYTTQEVNVIKGNAVKS